MQCHCCQRFSNQVLSPEDHQMCFVSTVTTMAMQARVTPVGWHHDQLNPIIDHCLYCLQKDQTINADIFMVPDNERHQMGHAAPTHSAQTSYKCHKIVFRCTRQLKNILLPGMLLHPTSQFVLSTTFHTWKY